MCICTNKRAKRLDSCNTLQCCVHGTLDAGGLSESLSRRRKTAAIASCEGDRRGSLVGRLPLAASTFRGDGSPVRGGRAGVGGAWSMSMSMSSAHEDEAPTVTQRRAESSSRRVFKSSSRQVPTARAPRPPSISFDGAAVSALDETRRLEDSKTRRLGNRATCYN